MGSYDWLPLWPVLLEVLGDVVVLDVLVQGMQGRDKVRSHIDDNVPAPRSRMEGKLEAEFVLKELELLFHQLSERRRRPGLAT